ncbi:MAG: phosphatidate cytidylyltransferase, partial [Oscillospiraceae bacterium]|nr:phosphatidate cytidylyltransferase [Oscillospiraceae bacterium]
MRTRVIVALLLLPLLFAVLYFAPAWVLPLAISLVSVLSVYELLGVSRFVQKKRVLAYAFIFSALVPQYDYWDIPGMYAAAGLLLFVAALFAEGIADPKTVTFDVIGCTFTFSLLFPVFLGSISRIMTDAAFGEYIVLFIFIVPFMGDIFAMLIGLAFGRHKLAPVISPKKSVEGAAGGLAAAMLFSAVYGFILQFAFSFTVSYPRILLTALLGSLAAQFGDLAMSYVKRGFHVKDFGNILPGHGGIFDRFDSLIFSAPVVELA